MQLFVRTLTGRSIALDIHPEQSVEYLKELTEAREGIPAVEQRLSCFGKPLRDECSLEEYGISSGSTLDLSLNLLGGGKKRKKKVFTKPKKIKHKHKKRPLAVLKYYKVENDGKITRMNRECPNKDCGAGVFMAKHFDREYCGKCGLTLLPVSGSGDE